MKNLFVGLVLIILSMPAYSQGEAKQVTIEAKFVEVEDDFVPELGYEFGVGPSISRFTNINNSSQISVVGYNVFGGIDYYVNPILGFFSHINITQFGNGFEFPGGSNVQKFTNVGIDAGIKVHLIPKVSKVNPYVLVNFDAGATVGGVAVSRINGNKDKNHFNISSNERKGYLGLGGGVGVTVRSDVVDLSIQAVVTGGLLDVFNNNNNSSVTPRSVPLLAEIPLIIRFFGKKKQQERPNLLIFLTPQIIDAVED